MIWTDTTKCLWWYVSLSSRVSGRKGQSWHMSSAFRRTSPAGNWAVLHFQLRRLCHSPFPQIHTCVYLILFSHRYSESYRWSELDSYYPQGDARCPDVEDRDEGHLTRTVRQLSRMDRQENHLKPELISWREGENGTEFQLSVDLPWCDVSKTEQEKGFRRAAKSHFKGEKNRTSSFDAPIMNTPDWVWTSELQCHCTSDDYNAEF